MFLDVFKKAKKLIAVEPVRKKNYGNQAILQSFLKPRTSWIKAQGPAATIATQD